MNLSIDNHLLSEYLISLHGLFRSAAISLERHDPEAASGLNSMLRAGGMMTIKTSVAPATGIGQIAIEATDVSGHTFTVAAMELESEKGSARH